MPKYLLYCQCGDTPKFSKDSFSLLFPDEPIPERWAQPKLYDLLSKLEQGTNFYEYVKMLVKSDTKFSYYVNVDDAGKIIERWNLLTGRKEYPC